MTKPTLTESALIRVDFFEPKETFYFGSLAAIYEAFTPKQVGCKIEALWAARITFGQPKATKKCLVSKHRLLRKRQSNARGL